MKAGDQKETHSCCSLHIQGRIISNQNPNLSPEEGRKRTTTKLKSRKRKEIINIRAETNKT